MPRRRQHNGEAAQEAKPKAQPKPKQKVKKRVRKEVKSAAPKRLTAIEKVKRDAEVVALRCSGVTFGEIATKFEISERMAQEVYYKWRDGAMETFADEDALGIAFEFAARFESIEARFAHLAQHADSDSAKVGALKALVDTTVKRMELLQATGKLPRDLGKLRLEIDVRHVSQVLIGVMEKYDMPIEAREEVRALLRGNGAGAEQN